MIRGVRTLVIRRAEDLVPALGHEELQHRPVPER
jgi:hypothetical protein